jgi:hypothetical protein
MSSKLCRLFCPVMMLPVVFTLGCTHTIKVEPIKVEPIDISLHIYLEADEKLDDFFADVEKAAPVSTAGGTKVEGEK